LQYPEDVRALANSVVVWEDPEEGVKGQGGVGEYEGEAVDGCAGSVA
jgi:hypothetical protein